MQIQTRAGPEFGSALFAFVFTPGQWIYFNRLDKSQDLVIIFTTLIERLNMNTVVSDKISQILQLCRKHNVRKLSLFGSAAKGSFQTGISDLDFLVEFEQMAPVRRAESYFGLMEDLQKLFGVSVDLIEPGPIRNPYFEKAVDETKVLLYAAA